MKSRQNKFLKKKSRNPDEPNTTIASSQAKSLAIASSLYLENCSGHPSECYLSGRSTHVEYFMPALSTCKVTFGRINDHNSNDFFWSSIPMCNTQILHIQILGDSNTYGQVLIVHSLAMHSKASR